jgi:hypothetical protein
VLQKLLSAQNQPNLPLLMVLQRHLLWRQLRLPHYPQQPTPLTTTLQILMAASMQLHGAPIQQAHLHRQPRTTMRASFCRVSGQQLRSQLGGSQLAPPSL